MGIEFRRSMAAETLQEDSKYRKELETVPSEKLVARLFEHLQTDADPPYVAKAIEDEADLFGANPLLTAVLSEFKEMDTNKDDKVSIEEWYAFWNAKDESMTNKQFKT